jgi:glycerol-3-phosphate dehydrogenase
VKGSHIVVPRLHDDARALILQNTDRRVVFAIPYEGRFTLIGTTDVPFDGDPGQVSISAEETLYLCDAANRAFRTQVAPEDVIHAFAGVRPLYDDGRSEASKVTRDYVLDLEDVGGVAPILSIYGGKITTYRRLAEHAMEKLLPFFPAASASWTDGAPLPGGDLPEGMGFYLHEFSRRHPWLGEPEAARLCRLYGTRAERIVARARGVHDLGVSYGAGLTEAELEHLITSEFARTAEDVLWRRTRLGLHLSADGIARLRARFGELEHVQQARSA